ncbi:MAG: O-antigen ligase family protein [Nitrospinae bacterium]|nr:O-antigen ligase family protein [Nitrospinota bacterium]
MFSNRTSSNASPHRLTNAVIRLHAFYFLIPWERVPYFPGQFVGPYKVYVLLFVLLCAAWMVEVVRFGESKPTFWCAVVILWFWMTFTVGIVHGYMQDDPIKTSVSLYRILAEAVPYADGMLVWHLIRNNRWRREEFEGALGSVFWVALAMGVESILFYYFRIPNPYSLNHEGRIFIGMFARHHIVASRLGLILAGVAFYLYWRKGGWLYLFASLAGILLVFSTWRRVPIFALFLGAFLLFLYFFKFRRRPCSKGIVKSYLVYCLTVLIFLSCIGLSVMVGTRVRAEFVEASNLSMSIKERLFQYARAADVLISRPFMGGGPRQGFFYGYSKDTPSRVSAYFYGDITRYESGIRGWSTSDLFQENPRKNSPVSLHSLPMNFIVDLGVLGLVLVMTMLRTGMMYFYRIMRLPPHQDSLGIVMPFAVIFSTVAALFVAVSTTAHFYPYWLFAILLCFVQFLYGEVLTGPTRGFPSARVSP